MPIVNQRRAADTMMSNLGLTGRIQSENAAKLTPEALGLNRKSGGRLTAKERQGLPKSEFALPGHGKGPKGAGAGSYPIPDKSHARNALARVAQHGTSAEKARVRAKVHAKYPDIGK